MLGTLNGALEVRGCSLPPENLSAEVEGINRIRDRLPLLEEILVHYKIRVPAADRPTLDRALESHASKCPTAKSLEGAVTVSWTADIQEV